jgi:hypothetical protein
VFVEDMFVTKLLCAKLARELHSFMSRFLMSLEIGFFGEGFGAVGMRTDEDLSNGFVSFEMTLKILRRGKD